MTHADWIKLAVGIVPSIIAAMLIFYMQRKQRQRDERFDREQRQRDEELRQRAEARKQESLLTLQGMMALGSLSQATALAVKRGHTNGEMEQALKDYDGYHKNLNDFLMGQAANSMYKR